MKSTKNDSDDSEQPSGDFVNELIEPAPLSSIPWAKPPFYHVTRARSRVFEEGLKAPQQLQSTELTFGHAGDFLDLSRVSLTASRPRAETYRGILEFLVNTAKQKVSPYDTIKFMLRQQARSFAALQPDPNTPESFGHCLCTEIKWFNPDEIWAWTTLSEADADSKWKACCSTRDASDSWEIVWLFERIHGEDLGSKDGFLGVVNRERSHFADVPTDEIAVLEVDVDPDSIVDVREEEEEIRVVPLSIISFRNIASPYERWTRL